jgi:hypothetical protein
MRPVSVDHRPPSTVHRPPSTVHRPPSTVHRPPSTIYRSPSTGHRPPSTGHRPPSTGHRPPSTIHHPPSTIHHPLSTFHLPQSTFHLPHTTSDEPDLPPRYHHHQGTGWRTRLLSMYRRYSARWRPSLLYRSIVRCRSASHCSITATQAPSPPRGSTRASRASQSSFRALVSGSTRAGLG